MPRPKGSKNKPKTGAKLVGKKATAKNYDALIAEKTAEAENLTAEISALTADLAALKAQIKTKKAALKSAENQLAKVSAKKAVAEEKAAAKAREAQVASVLDQLLAKGLTTEQIMEKLK